MAHKALVFLSCGQRPGERQLAKQIQFMIESEFHLNCYNADSRQGFEDVMSITEHLAQADYYLFIDFKRDGDIPISVFTHQEFALARAWGITELLAFREKGVRPYPRRFPSPPKAGADKPPGRRASCLGQVACGGRSIPDRPGADLLALEQGNAHPCDVGGDVRIGVPVE